MRTDENDHSQIFSVLDNKNAFQIELEFEKSPESRLYVNSDTVSYQSGREGPVTAKGKTATGSDLEWNGLMETIPSEVLEENGYDPSTEAVLYSPDERYGVLEGQRVHCRALPEDFVGINDEEDPLSNYNGGSVLED